MEDDLTDTWHGRFAFPYQFPPVAFAAELRQVGDLLSGSIEEPARPERGVGPTLTATLTGRVAAGVVSFLKLYDVDVPHFDGAIQYEGLVSDGGREISGTWTIPGNWSGTFMMIRARGLPQAQVIRETARL